MARIRTIKPEAFESESLAECSVTAMLTFFGLLTQADDSGRHRDHPAIIAGRLWALRPEHTATHVARDLEELAAAGLICRYTGCDGRTWLHIVTWKRHQKIDRPTDSRVPRCPSHQCGQKCGECKAAHCPGASRTEAAALASSNPRRGLDQAVSPDSASGEAVAKAVTAPGAASAGPPSEDEMTPTAPSAKAAGQTVFDEGSPNPRRGLGEGSSSGSRILDPGSVPTGREAPAPGTPRGAVCAKDLVAEYAKGCNRRPPSDTLGLLGRKIKTLLDEDFEPDDIRTAMDRLRAKGLHPSVLPSLVNEVVNASPQQAASPPSNASGAGPWASSGSAYTPYLNPTAPTTFGGRL
ncbi:hypothetical protein OG427_06940 [Streptomyces sp. NBC_00133]|uniref:hypothetical protein n=1 Tax=Streptomyces sp. NBC_00133 TaxID=2903624 RepID=UPI003245812A